MDSELARALVALTPRLRRFGLALTGSSADAEDLVQNACERALRRSDQLREPSRLDAWLYGIMRHLWLDEGRARRVRRHDDLASAESVIGIDGESNAIGRLTLEEVRRAIGGMSAEYRSVLILVCVDGMSYQEAAQILAVPLGTIMSRLARGRRELHERLTAKKSCGVVVFKSPADRMQPRSA